MRYTRLGVVLVLLFLFFCATETAQAAYQIHASGGQCREIGVWNPENLTCTLRQNITQTIDIYSQGVTIDGNGFRLDVSDQPFEGRRYGVHIRGVEAVTVRNLKITGASTGIYFERADHASAFGNLIEEAYVGISFFDGSTARVFDNVITDANTALSSASIDGLVVRGNVLQESGTALALSRSSNISPDSSIEVPPDM